MNTLHALNAPPCPGPAPRRAALALLLVASALLGGCATNPVTGKKELQLVSQGEEVAIGQQQYAPSRQMQGGDLTIDPGLTAYVNEVGQKLAAVSDRPLPYEFTVLNNGVPNAWALPGGKIAVNRGLLTQLADEAELAAVLGHEIVHAAARHGAKSMERGMLMQGAMVALAVGVADNPYANLVVGGATLGANLVTAQYGQGAELEADHYGILYMQKAGYDPQAAVSLQETFVRLSQGRQPGWLEGLFASHPPSPERVSANRKTAASVPAGGQRYRERYLQRTAELRRAAPAYAQYDEGVAALAKGDLAKAEASAQAALRSEPREAKFHELLGDVELKRRNWAKALPYYERAEQLNPGYFKPYLQSAVAKFESGDRKGAEPLLAKSMELLPTATGALLLGRVAEEKGDLDGALKYYQAAAASESDVGAAARREGSRIGLARDPAQFFALEPRLARDGQVYAAIQNRAGVAVTGVRFVAAVVDASGAVQAGPYEVNLGRQILQPNEVATVATRLGPYQDPNVLPYVKFQIRAAQAVPAN